MHNTFTCRHSDLPPVRSEIKAESVVALDCQISDLILKSQGNYHELKELAEVPDNCLDSCELNLNSLQVVPDIYKEKSGGLLDLPQEQKEFIYGQLVVFSVVMESWMKTARIDRDTANSIIYRAIEQHIPKPSKEEVDNTLLKLLECQAEQRKTES